MTMHVVGGNPADPFRQSLEEFCEHVNQAESERHFRAYGYTVTVYLAPAGVIDNDCEGWAAEIEGHETPEGKLTSWHDRLGLYATRDTAVVAAVDWCEAHASDPPQGEGGRRGPRTMITADPDNAVAHGRPPQVWLWTVTCSRDPDALDMVSLHRTAEGAETAWKVLIKDVWDHNMSGPMPEDLGKACEHLRDEADFWIKLCQVMLED
jgi:hypothetical protein